MKFLAWLFSVIFAFNMGAGLSKESPEDSELKQKVRDHVDAIVDETAGLVDDVIEEVRSTEEVQKAEAFAEDVREIVNNTLDDIHEKFGSEEEEENAEETVEETEETGEVKETEEAKTEEAEETQAGEKETEKE